MFTTAQINEALKNFSAWSNEDTTKLAIKELMAAGELEVVAIVDGQFVWRVPSPPKAEE